MSWKISDFRDSLREELGDELYDLVGGDRPFDRWVNAGQRKLGSYLKKRLTVAWAAGDSSFALPADFHHLDTIVPAVGSCVPAGSVWGGEYIFAEAAPSSGSADLRYYANRPKITGSVESTHTDEGNEALLSYALYRFFKRLSSSRADYRMYATITGSNGVDIAEVEGISERHLQDFKDAADTLEPLQASTPYVD